MKLSPSLMCADMLDLGRELDLLVESGVDLLHLDIMDGHYVPNLTLGIDFCRAVARRCSIPQDVHLMVENPDAYLEMFAGLPGARLTFHPETSRHPVRTIARIRELGAQPGIAIDPAFSASAFAPLFPLVDQVCVMTVNPGYAGQKLVPHTLQTLADVRALASTTSNRIDIEVDGNVSWENIPRMVHAGADVLVLGTSSLFDPKLPRKDAMARLRDLILSL